MAAAVVGAAAGGGLASVAGGLVIGILVLAFLLYRQLRVRAVGSNLVVPVVLTVLGVLELSNYAGNHHLGERAILTLVFSLLVFAIGLGAARAWTVKLWVAAGRVMRQGTWVTIVIWLIAVGLHLAVDSATKVGSVSLLLYLGLTLGAQQLAVLWRVRQMGLSVAGPPGPQG